MSSNDEFPCLSQQGLYPLNIPGDGNCLFSALSDQIYGSIDYNTEIRARTIKHIQSNKDYYIQFINVVPGGGTRRQPKRKVQQSHSNAHVEITDEDREQAFRQYVREMSKGGTYGDNLEIVAFASCYDVNVRIFQATTSYIISAPLREGLQATTKVTAHIAYHDSYLHYSSVRNVHGPHSGLPEIKFEGEEPASPGGAASVPSDQTLPQWMIKAVVTSCYYPIDEPKAVQALSLNNNSVDGAVTWLIEQDRSSYTPDFASVQSSSVERELASDEETREQKRQDRRLSRARKERQSTALRQKMKSLSADSLESLATAEATRRHNELAYQLFGSDDDFMSSPPPLADGSTSPDSSYSPASEESVPPKPKITLKLSTKTESALITHRPHPTKLVLKHSGPKKAVSARDTKALKKQAQKQARKERSQNSTTSNRPASFVAGTIGSSQSSNDSTPPVANGFRTMHI